MSKTSRTIEYYSANASTFFRDTVRVDIRGMGDIRGLSTFGPVLGLEPAVLSFVDRSPCRVKGVIGA